jgi:hypothetical protein
MYSKKTAELHLYLIAGCLFVADFLPRWHKLWFVTETGNFSTSAFVSLLLVVALFKRWRHAFGLMVVWLIVRFCLSASIVYHNIADEGPILGHLIINTLNLAALGILCCSSDIRRYLNDKAQPLARD